MRWVAVFLVALAAPAMAATSSRSVPSTFGGNGHNAAFDGRLFIVRRGLGWFAYVLRPEAVTYLDNGLPDATGPMWSDRMLIFAADAGGGVNLLGRLFQRVLAAREEYEVHAFAGQPPGDVLADALAAAGDERDAPFEFEIHKMTGRLKAAPTTD